MSLENYLDELAEQGAHNSRGGFTLNQAEAIQKLQQYQVSDPSEFVVALVASAVAAGAQWVRLESTSSQFQLEHNGRTIGHDEMVNLFSTLLVSGPDEELAAVQELAFGLNALSALNPSQIRVVCSDPAHLVLLELSSKSLRITKADPYETYGDKKITKISAHNLKRGIAVKLLRGLGFDKFLAVIRERCFFVPIEIYWGGQKVECPSPLPEAICQIVSGAARSRRLDWPAPWTQVEGELRTQVGFCPESPGRLGAVVHGVYFELNDPQLPQGICAVVWDNRFRKDLSHSGIVRDKFFEECQKFLKGRSYELLLMMIKRINQFEIENRRLLAHSVKAEIEAARQRWEADAAQRLEDAAMPIQPYL